MLCSIKVMWRARVVRHIRHWWAKILGGENRAASCDLPAPMMRERV